MEKTRVIAAGFIFLFLGVNFMTLDHYGKTHDEDRVATRGRISLKLIVSAFGGPDVTPSEKQTLYALKHPPFSGIVIQLLSPLGKLIGLDPVASRHFVVVLWSSLGLMFLFLLGERLFSSIHGLIAIVLLMLFPPFIAHSHFNSKDIPLMVNAVISVYFFVRFLDKRTLLSAAISGTAFGLTVATHLGGLLLLGVFTATAFMSRRVYPPLTPGLFVMAGVSLVTLMLAWPLLIMEPFRIVDSVRFFSGQFRWFRAVYFGQHYLPSELPWHYTPIVLFISTPLLHVILTAIGIAIVIYYYWNTPQMRFLIMLAAWAGVSIASQMIPGTSRYDGYRHIFIAVPPLILFASVAAEEIHKRVCAAVPLNPMWVRGGFLGLALLIMLPQIVQVHPLESGYRNELVRLAVPAKTFDANFSETTWGSPSRNGIEWLNENAAPNAVVCFSHPGLIFEIKRPDLLLDCNRPADYVMFFGENSKIPDILNTHERVFTAGPYGAPTINIFKIKRTSS